jgi:hypothetical protein
VLRRSPYMPFYFLVYYNICLEHQHLIQGISERRLTHDCSIIVLLLLNAHHICS